MPEKKNVASSQETLLKVEHLCQYFKENKAVDDVSFEVKKGEVFGLVGESGCGKTTTGRSIIKLYNITSGNVYFKGERIAAGTGSYKWEIEKAKKAYTALKKSGVSGEKLKDAKKKRDEVIAEQKKQIRLAQADQKRRRAVTDIQMIFQDPIASIDPRMTVRQIIAEGLVIRGEKDQKKIDEEVYRVLELVGLVREHAGRYPLAVVSMDNCSHNGEKLQASVMTIAKAWAEKGFVTKEFIKYLEDESSISFPWSMIDKITPRPAKAVEEKLEAAGVEEMAPVITSRNTYIAPFVNAEGPQYLVIEDKFPAGRPALEKAGVYLTDRDTVNRVERMKVTTCLNPLHTALAVYGCLLGYNLIADEMNDKELTGLIRHIGYDEGMKVVTDPGILSPKAFIDEVIEKRLPNPFMPDTPQRIATDTSQKIVVRFGETMKSYMASSELDCSSLVYIPLAIAGWLRYLLGKDDKLEKMELSSDPMLAKLQEKLSGVEAGKPETYTGQLKEILTNKAIFGVDMYEAGLADKVEGMFVEMLAGKDAVRNTLKKYVD